jgi:exodeoxyribonuclease III
MKIITLNVNGIRSAARYGFFDWLKTQNADVVCVQEVKAHEEQLVDALFYPEGMHCYYHCAQKKGYSGVALYSKIKPNFVQIGIGIDWIDFEGRYLRTDFDNFSIISLYLPSGTTGELRQNIKYQMMDAFLTHIQTLKKSGKELIICGDWNIAHQPIDLKNWRANQKNSGFLPEERQWLDRLLGEEEFVDAFRVLNSEPDQYTWWSNRGQAYTKNVGWRIDYQIVTPGIKNKIRAVAIYKDQRFSDHAPLIIHYS